MRRWLEICSLAVVMLGAVAMAQLAGPWLAETDPLQPAIAQKVLRFHVLADGDSQYDQELKLKVRDSVGRYIESEINNSTSLEKTIDIINQHMDNIIEIAEETTRSEGKGESVSAGVKRTEFPEKSYGNFTFPAGDYLALELVIGSGEGRNWWCVLYPNLCFRGTMYEAVSDEAGEALREVLSPEEYRDVLESGNYEVRIRFLDWLTKMKG